MPQIKQECEHCGGTGLYSGFAEPRGTAVVCLGCTGRGWNILTYKEFTHRKHKKGIKTISISRGGFLASGVGAVPKTEMTYEEFEKKYPS